MFGLSILCGEKNCASTEVQMLYLNPDKLADSTAEFIDDLKHQLMIVIVNTIEEILELINGQIADDLAEAFIFF